MPVKKAAAKRAPAKRSASKTTWLFRVPDQRWGGEELWIVRGTEKAAGDEATGHDEPVLIYKLVGDDFIFWATSKRVTEFKVTKKQGV